MCEVCMYLCICVCVSVNLCVCVHVYMCGIQRLILGVLLNCSFH